MLSSKQILFQISQVFFLSGVWQSFFYKREESYVSAYFISFLFIIHTIWDRRNIFTQSIFLDVSSEKYTQPKPQRISFPGGWREAQWRWQMAFLRHILTAMLQWVSSSGIYFLTTWIRPVALYPKTIEE